MEVLAQGEQLFMKNEPSKHAYLVLCGKLNFYNDKPNKLDAHPGELYKIQCETQQQKQLKVEHIPAEHKALQKSTSNTEAALKAAAERTHELITTKLTKNIDTKDF